MKYDLREGWRSKHRHLYEETFEGSKRGNYFNKSGPTGVTFDMSCGRMQALPVGGRPLDGRVKC